MFTTHSVKVPGSLLILPTYFLLKMLFQLAGIGHTPSPFVSDIQSC